MDQLVEGGIADVDGARADEADLADCVVVTHDTEAKTITMDFGDGCEGPHGNIRKGKMIIEYNDRKYVPGAYRITTFEDFYFNDIKVEGTRTKTNTTSTDNEIEFTVKLEGGKLDFGDGVFATREAEWVRTWFVGQGQVTRSGTAEGTTIDGIPYSITVDVNTPLVFKRGCGNGLPVSGIKEMAVGNREASIDYGDGTCDRVVTITMNGETVTREINPRRGR